VIVIFCIAEYGDGPLCGMFVWSSCVYTDLNCAFIISALINIYTMQNTRAYSKFKYHETSRYP
jgi:hypothetical protein